MEPALAIMISTVVFGILFIISIDKAFRDTNKKMADSFGRKKRESEKEETEAVQKGYDPQSKNREAEHITEYNLKVI